MTYLSSLTKAQLIELIQFTETLDPKLPIYSPNTHAIAVKMQLENDQKEHHTTQSKVNYEDLLVEAINAKSTGDGVEISEIWKWIAKYVLFLIYLLLFLKTSIQLISNLYIEKVEFQTN